MVEFKRRPAFLLAEITRTKCRFSITRTYPGRTDFVLVRDEKSQFHLRKQSNNYPTSCENHTETHRFAFRTRSHTNQLPEQQEFATLKGCRNSVAGIVHPEK